MALRRRAAYLQCMRIARLALLVLSSSFALTACGGATSSSLPGGAQAPSQDDTSAKIAAALAGPARTAAERARDVHRHPAETLAFFGLRDDMSVVELAPGGGWYTAVLAPVLRDRGKLTVTTYDPNGPADDEATRDARALADRFAKAPDAFGKVQTALVGGGRPLVLGPDGSADMVVTFRNVHNWIGGGRLGVVLAAVHRVLKPGGILGVEDHRANAGGPTDAKTIDSTGYVPQAYVVEQIEAAGFKLV